MRAELERDGFLVLERALEGELLSRLLNGGIDLSGVSPLRRQLLGHATTDLGYWLPTDEETPLRSWLDERGLLDPAVPSHR